MAGSSPAMTTQRFCRLLLDYALTTLLTTYRIRARKIRIPRSFGGRCLTS
jgi:hypothetical protein